MFSYYFFIQQLPTIPTLQMISLNPLITANYLSTTYSPNISPIDSLRSITETSAYKIEAEPQPQPVNSAPKVSPFKYAKKNVESNVVNQVYSFISTRSKSQAYLIKILKSGEKVTAFYEILKQAKKKNHKYMGRNILKELTELSEQHPIRILHNKISAKVNLTIQEIKKGIRILIIHFLNNQIVVNLLTSSKLDRSTVREHLIRGREILAFLQKFLKVEEEP